jgi:hypothetical protein
MEITGKIIDIIHGDKVSTVVIEVPGQYPKKFALTMFDKLKSVFDKGLGDTITAHINIESREYNGKWYTNALIWKYE